MNEASGALLATPLTAIFVVALAEAAITVTNAAISNFLMCLSPSPHITMVIWSRQIDKYPSNQIIWLHAILYTHISACRLSIQSNRLKAIFLNNLLCFVII